MEPVSMEESLNMKQWQNQFNDIKLQGKSSDKKKKKDKKKADKQELSPQEKKYQKEKKKKIKYFQQERKQVQSYGEPQDLEQIQSIIEYIRNTLQEIKQSPFKEQASIIEIKEFFNSEKKRHSKQKKLMKEKKKQLKKKKQKENDDDYDVGEDSIQQVRDLIKKEEKKKKRRIVVSDQQNDKRDKKKAVDKKIKQLQGSESSEEEEEKKIIKKVKRTQTKKHQEQELQKKKTRIFPADKGKKVKPQISSGDDEDDDDKIRREDRKKANLLQLPKKKTDKRASSKNQQSQQEIVQIKPKKKGIDSDDEDENDNIKNHKRKIKEIKQQKTYQDQDQDQDQEDRLQQNRKKKPVKAPLAKEKKEEKIPDDKVKLGCKHIVSKDHLQQLIKKRTNNLVSVCAIDNLGEICFKCPKCYYLINTKDMSNIFGEEKFQKYANKASQRMILAYNDDGNLVKQGKAPEKCLLCDSKTKTLKTNHDDHSFCVDCWQGAQEYYQRSLGCLSQNCHFFQKKFAVMDQPNPYAQFKKKPEENKEDQSSDSDSSEKIPKSQGKKKPQIDSDNDQINVKPPPVRPPQASGKKHKCENCQAEYQAWKFDSCQDSCKISQCKKCTAKFFTKNGDIKDCFSCYESISKTDLTKFLKTNVAA